MSTNTKSLTIRLDGKIIWKGQVEEGQVLIDTKDPIRLSTDFFHLLQPKVKAGRPRTLSDKDRQEYKRNYYQRNRKRIIARQLKWYRANRDRVLSRAKEQRQ